MINSNEVGRAIGALAEIGADYSAHRNRAVSELLKEFRAKANRELATFAGYQLGGDGERRLQKTRQVLFDIYRAAADAAAEFNDSSLRDVSDIASEGLVEEELT